MIKRLLAVLALALAILGVVAVPAQAVPTGQLWMWDWVNFNSNGGRIIFGAGTIINSTDGGVTGCLNLNDWQLDNGLNASNRASSFAANNLTGSGWLVGFYDNLNCTTGAGLAVTFRGNTNREDNDLHNSDWAGYNMGNKITSIRIWQSSAPPNP